MSDLGYTPLSAIDRRITPAPELDKFFPSLITSPIKKKLTYGSVDETVFQMMRIVKHKSHEVAQALHLVRGNNVYDTAKNIFDFLFKYVKYNIERGEILNTPAVSWYYGQILARQDQNSSKLYPVDCDDFSIFAASFLQELGYKWAFRIASYDGWSYGHVYCVVPLPNEQYIIIDPVYYQFNTEKPYKMQKTIYPDFSRLSGIDIFYNGISGELSGVSEQTIPADQYFSTTARIIESFDGIVDDDIRDEYVGMLNGAVAMYETDSTEALGAMAMREAELIELGAIPSEDEDYGVIGALFKRKKNDLSKSKFWKKVDVVREKVNRVNPTTILARNGLRALFLVNFRDVAGRLSQDPDAYQKSREMYINLGGKGGIFDADIRNGAKRKPLFKAEGSVQLDGFMDDESITVDLGDVLGLTSSLYRQVENYTVKQPAIVKPQVKTPIKQQPAPKFVAKKVKPNALHPLHAILVLISINYNGIASLMASSPEILETAALNYVRSGGKIDNFQLAIIEGKEKTPMLNSQTISLGELGEVIATTTALASAGVFLTKIFGFLSKNKDAVDAVKDVAGDKKNVSKLKNWLAERKAKRAAKKAAKENKNSNAPEKTGEPQDSDNAITANAPTNEVTNSNAIVSNNPNTKVDKQKERELKKEKFNNAVSNIWGKASEFLNKKTMTDNSELAKEQRELEQDLKQSQSNAGGDANNVAASNNSKDKNKIYKLVIGSGLMVTVIAGSVMLFKALNKKGDKPANSEPMPDKLGQIDFK